MKKLLVVVLAFLTLSNLHAQKIEDELISLKNALENFSMKYEKEGTSIKFQKIIELDENNPKTKEQLYYIAKDFLIKNYGDANKTTQLDDKENGKIITKGLFGDITCGCGNIVFSGSAMEYTATHILQLDFKDNRIRITLTLTEVKQKSGGTGYGTTYIPLRYVDFNILDFYPFKTDCTVFTGNHRWSLKEGSKLYYKGEYHEGSVLLVLFDRVKNTIESLESCFRKNNIDSQEDNW